MGFFFSFLLGCNANQEELSGISEKKQNPDIALLQIDTSGVDGLVLSELQKDSVSYLLLFKGMDFASRNVFDSSLYILRLAEESFLTGNNLLGHAKAKLEIAKASYFSGVLSSCIDSLRMVKDLIKDELETHVPMKANSEYYIARAFFDLGDKDSAKSHIEKAIHLYHSFSFLSEELADCYLLLGEIHLDLFGDYKQAENFLEEAKLIFRKGNWPVSETRASFALARLARKKGDYQNSIAILKTLLKHRMDLLPAGHELIVNSFINIGNTYFQIRKLDTASLFYREALTQFESQTRQTTKQATILHNLGLISEMKGNYDKSLNFYQQALAIQTKAYGREHPEVANTLLNLGLLRIRMGDFIRAEQLYKESLLIQKSIYSPNHPELALSVIEVGYLYEVQGQLGKALTYYEQASAIVQINDTIKEADGFTYQSISHAPMVSLSAFEARLDMLLGLFQQDNGREEYLFSVLEIIDQTDELIEQVRREFKLEDRRINFSNRTLAIYEKGIETCFKLSQTAREKKDAYLDKALYYMEKSRNVAMMESLFDSKAKFLAQIPGDILSRENRILDSLKLARKALYAFQHSPNRDTTSEVIQGMIRDQELIEKIYVLKKEHETLIKQIEEIQPLYTKIKYDFYPSTVSDLQASLAPSDALCEYFISGSSLYSLLITKDRLSGFEKPFSQKEIQTITQSIHLLNPRSMYQNWQGNLDSLAGVTHQMFQLLLADELSNLESADSITQLMIVPHGILSRLPFEILTTQSHDAFSHFLIQNYGISYSHSASRLLQSYLKAHKPPKHQVLGFAFSDLGANQTSSTVSTLRGAAVELDYLSDRFNGIYHYGAEARREIFLKRAHEFSFLHLALHGVEASEHTDLPALYFPSPDTPFVEEVDLIDLMNLRISSDLVTIGACETGIGKERAGEGMASMAYGFMYAGAKSVITSLWPVDDHTSADLMKRFYKELSNGLPKNVALQQAKKDYLAEADPLQKHPYFWAPYVLYGETDSVDLPKKNNRLFQSSMWGLMILVGIGLYQLYLRMNQKTQDGNIY